MSKIIIGNGSYKNIEWPLQGFDPAHLRNAVIF
jgi:hypothetical protein